VQILWWLVPPVVATVLAMLWISWLGREGRGQVDREVAVRRLGEAMARTPRTSRVTTRPPAPHDRSTGVAVRPSTRPSGRGSDRGQSGTGDATRRAS
jgi:hypothetical protein